MQRTSTSHAYSDPSKSVTLHCIFFGFLTIFRGDLESLLDDDFWESLSSSSWWYSSCFALAAANSCSFSVACEEKDKFWSEINQSCNAVHYAPCTQLGQPSMGHAQESPWCRTESSLSIEKIPHILPRPLLSLQNVQNTHEGGAYMKILSISTFPIGEKSHLDFLDQIFLVCWKCWIIGKLCDERIFLQFLDTTFKSCTY